ncbi:MAG: PstS family phosphate ABC transporter substrate-binding protein [Gemmatimonadota bacterium]|nr:PstS family phosphate ABC transporter substrate-binding protein [Gemmatimonadota bacterium]MDH3424738.1 PstS family phosphate ABC transporter substrate-binding protein [Gemmatimonadota bacterium]
MNERSSSGSSWLAALVLLMGCGGAEGGDSAMLSGSVQIDGSSTVFPIAEAVAEEFQAANRSVRVTVGVSGSGGGFERFCNGEIDITNASRPIRDSEIEECAAAGIQFTEVPVAWDGLSIIVNPQNDFLTCVTTDELRRIWAPDMRVSTWRDVRAGWPDEEIRLYGPGTDSGTFDYFTETIVGESGASRPDFQASEDDNILVQGVAGDRFALGYFGYAYYAENAGRLKLVEVDGGTGCVAPSDETIENGTYAPLARPLFFYVKHAALQRPEVRAYVEFMLREAPTLVPATGYHALSAAEYEEDLALIARVAGGGA